MAKKKKAKKTREELKKSRFERKIKKIVNLAIDCAVEDTGVDPKNYGMLEERIYWYLDLVKYDLGYEVAVKFDRKTCTVLIKSVKEFKIPEEEDPGVYV